MGGEGSMMAANQSLKNNRSQLSKRKDKKALGGSYANIQLKEFPKATNEQLQGIKERLQKENKQTRLKQFILFIFLIAVMCFVIALV